MNRAKKSWLGGGERVGGLAMKRHENQPCKTWLAKYIALGTVGPSFIHGYVSSPRELRNKWVLMMLTVALYHQVGQEEWRGAGKVALRNKTSR